MAAGINPSFAAAGKRRVPLKREFLRAEAGAELLNNYTQVN